MIEYPGSHRELSKAKVVDLLRTSPGSPLKVESNLSRPIFPAWLRSTAASVVFGLSLYGLGVYPEINNWYQEVLATTKSRQ